MMDLLVKIGFLEAFSDCHRRMPITRDSTVIITKSFDEPIKKPPTVQTIGGDLSQKEGEFN